MKALVLTAYEHFEWMDVERPAMGDTDVLIRVKACAVCGSDAHGTDGSTGRRVPPIIMGHEAAGVIEACGSAVSGWKAGDRVTFDSTIYCRACEFCAEGRVNLCSNRRVLGVSCDEYRQNGAFAEFVVVPAFILYALPDTVSFVQAAMVEPFSVAYHAVKRAPIPAGGTALVIGAGTIGMLAVQALRAEGVSRIIAADIAQNRLDFALSHGVAYAVNSRDADCVEQILALTPDGQGADVCYDASGLQATLDLALGAVKKGGHIVLIGNIAQTVDVPLQRIVTRELSLYGSCASAGEYDTCLERIAAGAVDVDSLISATVPMKDGGEWIARLRAGKDGLSKIVLIP